MTASWRGASCWRWRWSGQYSKQEILEMYLNEVVLRHGAYGVKVAWPGCSLTRRQGADAGGVRAAGGLPQRPTMLSPYVNPDAAKRRRHQVLLAMVREGCIGQAEGGQGGPGADEPGEACAAGRGCHPGHRTSRTRSSRGLCERYGVDTVYSGGLRVYTTLDTRLQDAADQAVTNGSAPAGARPASAGRAGRAGVRGCADGRGAGDVGGWDRTRSAVQPRAPGAATVGRQPGSAFKPYVVGDGARFRVRAGQSVWRADLHRAGGAGSTGTPKNAGAGRAACTRCPRPLAHSVNLYRCGSCSAWVWIRSSSARRGSSTSPSRAWQRCRRLALGCSELFAAGAGQRVCGFAYGGIRNDRNLVRRSVTGGQPAGAVRAGADPRSGCWADVCVSMIKMMRGVVSGGTGRRAAGAGQRQGVREDRGTTQDGPGRMVCRVHPESASGCRR